MGDSSAHTKLYELSPFRQFAGCLRRFAVNGYLQTLSMEESASNEYFTRTVTGDVSSQCDIGSAHLAVFQTPGVLASIICVGILAIAVLAVFALARFVRRHQDKKESSWQRTREIDAYAMRKPRIISTENGHVNHAMNSSVDSLYATADGYETPIGHAYREHKPHLNTKRIVGDVVLGVRNNSSSDIDRHSFPSKHSYEEPEPPPVPQRMYRNMTYF
ncbi:unnamed protein product [Cylicocyclus nassatus]|uniref:Uncharacterized protein n=1 Tax=Cylicocyclus nassatus TaxID=53992 RepID=A0AA36GX99_CYLNA|nr:unnamed protein product [Cylicocyclus nassatus]